LVSQDPYTGGAYQTPQSYFLYRVNTTIVTPLQVGGILCLKSLFPNDVFNHFLNEKYGPHTPLEIQVFAHTLLLKIRLSRPPFPLEFEITLIGVGDGTTYM